MTSIVEFRIKRWFFSMRTPKTENVCLLCDIKNVNVPHDCRWGWARLGRKCRLSSLKSLNTLLGLWLVRTDREEKTRSHHFEVLKVCFDTCSRHLEMFHLPYFYVQSLCIYINVYCISNITGLNRYEQKIKKKLNKLLCGPIDHLPTLASPLVLLMAIE